MAGRSSDAIRVVLHPGGMATGPMSGGQTPAPSSAGGTVPDGSSASMASTGGAKGPVMDLEDAGLKVEVSQAQLGSLLEERLQSVTHVYSTLTMVGRDLVDFFPKVPEILPPAISGRLLNPDGSPAAYVSVQAEEPTPDAGDPVTPWPTPQTTTDRRGAYQLSLPARPVPTTGLTLLVQGSNRTTEVLVRRTDLVASKGSLGVQPLDEAVEPLPRSITSQLGDVIVPTAASDVLADPASFADPVPVLTLGEGDCARSFRSNSGVIDQFRFSLFVRLVAPQLSGRKLGSRIKSGDGSYLISSSAGGLGQYVEAGQLIEALNGMGTWELAQRVPVDQPIDVTRFRDIIENIPTAMPKAASLGLGYVVGMHQVWIPTGLSLGDLVYSLPLAPGEQQRIAVADTRETLSVRDAETLTADEYQRYQESADSSTNAVFSSAFNEAAAGGSQMRTRTEAGSIGGATGAAGIVYGVLMGGGIAGGYSDSTTTGSSSSWQNASRDYVSNATQDFHSQLGRQAAARRSSARTSVRLATASESSEIVTKVITNHNHNHALTMQYWEVLRHFAVSTSVDDVQLVCLVPLEVVQFLPLFQQRLLPTGTYTRDQLLTRYAQLVRYHDVLEQRLWWRPELAHGLRLMQSFAANPTMTVQGSSGSAQDVVRVTVTGTFLPFEDVSVSIVSTTGARVGPVRLQGSSADIATGAESRDALLELLRQRRAATFETRTGALVLPDYISRSDIARFEFSRSFRTFSYQLTVPTGLDLGNLLGWLSVAKSLGLTLTAADLEREVGGPTIQDPTATIDVGSQGSGPAVLDVLEAYNGPNGTQVMPAILPVAAKRLPPVLAFADVLRIEAVLQHVVQNTVPYSKAVWESLTSEERAIMLERFTIGVPTGGVADPSSEVPLLDCVANQVLGYFGNSAIMPFFLPATLAGEMKFTSRDVQDALLKFHRQAFAPPRSSITLPARGVLGEAVLGSCESSEKIDLTRFWNWQDSPADTATDPSQLTALVTSPNPLVGSGGAQAPNTLSNGTSMVTINSGPAALTPADLAAALIKSQPASSLPTDLTGLTQLAAQMKVQTETTADSLNKTIGQATDLAKTAMTNLPQVIAAKQGGSTAGKGAGSGSGTGSGGTGSGSAGTGSGSAGTGSGGTGTGSGGTGSGGTGTGGTGTGGTGTGSGGTGTGSGGTGVDTSGATDGGSAPATV